MGIVIPLPPLKVIAVAVTPRRVMDIEQEGSVNVVLETLGRTPLGTDGISEYQPSISKLLLSLAASLFPSLYLAFSFFLIGSSITSARKLLTNRSYGVSYHLCSG